MVTNRAGGCSGDVSVNPPADSFEPQESNKRRLPRLTLDFQQPDNQPTVLDIDGQVDALARKRYPDARSEQTKMFLETVGFEHMKHYLPTTGHKTVRRAHELLLFDIEYQSMLLKYVGFFEIAFRARYAQAMADLRGAFAHRDPRNFLDKDHFSKFLSSYSIELSRSISHKGPELDSYRRYGDLPIWQAVEIMPLGMLSKLYRNTKSKAVKRRVAESFGTDFSTLSSWLRSISMVRNRCAHFGKLAGRSLASQPVKIEGVSISTSCHFYIVLLLIMLLHEQKSFVDDPTLNHDYLLIRDVSELIIERQHVLADAGIPFNWQTLIKTVCIKSGITISFNEGSPDIARRHTYMCVHGPDGSTVIVD